MVVNSETVCWLGTVMVDVMFLLALLLDADG